MKKWLSCVPLGLCAVISCGGGRTPAAVIAPPLPVPKACTDEPDMRERLVIDWSSLDRSKLEAIARVGVVAVRVEGCRMRVVDGCASPHGYSYVATSRQREVTLLRGDDELGIELPMLMGRIGGSINASSSLNVALNVVGRYQADGLGAAAALKGDCGAATHVVASFSVGAFQVAARSAARIAAGTDVVFAKASAGSAAERELLDSGGVESRCAESRRQDVAPPEDCGLPLRVELRRIHRAGEAPSAALDRAAAKVLSPSVPLLQGEAATLRTAMALSRERVAPCYRRALARDRHLKGNLTLLISVAPDGLVRKVDAKYDVSAELADCALSSIGEVAFPRSAEGRPQSFVVPMFFNGT